MPTRSPRALLARWLARRARRRSISLLLARPDDRLIEDIGLTRDALQRLLDAPDPRPTGETERAARRPPLSVFSKYARGARR